MKVYTLKLSRLTSNQTRALLIAARDGGDQVWEGISRARIWTPEGRFIGVTLTTAKFVFGPDGVTPLEWLDAHAARYPQGLIRRYLDQVRRKMPAEQEAP